MIKNWRNVMEDNSVVINRRSIKKNIISHWKTIFTIFVLFTIAIIGYIYVIHPLDDPDAYWHIATGRYIMTTHSIPYKDIFSWYGIQMHFKWINHEWLYDTIIYNVYSISGLKGTIVFTGIIFILLLNLIYIYTKKRSNSRIIAIIATIIATIGLNSYMVPRPQTISYLLLMLILIFLENEKWWYTIPIVIIGVNMHGGFSPMYILMIIFYAWRKKPLLIPIAIASMSINAYGLKMYTYPILMEKCTEFYKYISEWVRTPLYDYKFALGLYIVVIITLINNRRKWKIEDIVLSLLITVLTLTAIRQLVFLYFFIFPFLSPYIMDGSLRIYSISKKFIMDKIKYFKTINLNNNIIKEILLVVVLLGFITSFYMAIKRTYELKQVVPANLYPTKAVKYMKEHHITHYFNEYNIGGYLIFEGMHPLVDGRTDIFVHMYNDTNIFEEMVKVERRESDYQSFIRQYNIRYIVIDKDFYLNIFLLKDPEMVLIYHDDNFNIFYYKGL